MDDKIVLSRTWLLGSQLDSGGFGRIFEAVADDDSAAVVKLVPKAPGASRELLFEPLSGSPNIIPILDLGEWNDSYAIVMPQADKSLRHHLESSGDKLGFDESITVLTDVANGLAVLNSDVVHRDLKPENILLFDGHWCLADFGIARYAEAATAPDTHKYSMTPPYAAPEQWRMERATYATDVYAFGIIAFEIVQGMRPFPGPETADFREQHLTQSPPSVRGCPSWFASLVSGCLSKAQAARPTPTDILERLHPLQELLSPSTEKLQAVNKSIVEKQAAQEAAMYARQSREESRRELFKAAEQVFGGVLEEFKRRVLEAAPATNISTAQGLTLQLGDGALAIDSVQTAPADCLAAYDYAPPFDVIAYSTIAARKPRDRYGYEGRSHSLWYCDAQEEGLYRWYELAFMVNPFIAERYSFDPFALPPTDNVAAEALTPVMTIRQVAWQPIIFDQGDKEQFIERWLVWFADAAGGSLSHPSQMPENSGGKFRPPRRRT